SVVNLKGKFKRGAKVIEPGTILCQVKCEGVAKLFNIRAGVPGRVIEINELVKERPNLLRTDPKGDGFLAVLAPMGHPSKYEEEMNKLKLLSEEEYMDNKKAQNCLKSILTMSNTFQEVHGFCPDCGTVLPPLAEKGGVTCYGCSRIFNTNIASSMFY
ncbi:hypothetical protein NQ315_017315, partial [Exocentrus adspersus]